jgi:hypothetical protein
VVAFVALLLAGCGGASPRPSALDAAAAPPEQVVLRSDRTTNSITVSWLGPESDAEITHYELRWRAAGEESWTEVPEIPGSLNNYEISGLQESSEYEVQMRAVSAAGTGEWSASLSVSTVTAGVQTPSPPSSPSTATVTSSSAVITWSAPDTDLTIIKYVVQWIEAPAANATARPGAQGGIDWTNAETAETQDATPSITLDGLDPGTKYLVRARAVTEEVDGDWSEPIEVTTTSDGGTETAEEVLTGLPAPTGLQATAIGETSIDITWNAVTAPEGFTLTGYTVEWRESGAASWESDSAGTSTSHTVSGLSEVTTYELRVRADGTDSGGVSVSSAPSGAITVVTDGCAHPDEVPTWTLVANDITSLGVVGGTPTYQTNESEGSVFLSVFAVRDNTEEGRKQRESIVCDATVSIFVWSSGVPLTTPTGFQTHKVLAGATGFSWKIAWDTNDPMKAMKADGTINVTIGDAIQINVIATNKEAE